MSDTMHSDSASATRRQRSGSEVQPSGWVGWIVFAALMMVMLGTFHAIQGLVALFRDQYFVVAPSGLVVNVDYTTWGWVHLLLGVVVALAGVALFNGSTWARVVGICLAFVSTLVNIAFLAAFPLWSAMMIGVCVMVIWALTVHGDEMK